MPSAAPPVHHSPRWVRPVIGLVLTVAWLAIAGLGGPIFGRIGEVSTNDQAAFLPQSAESTVVDGRLGEFLGDDAIPAIVIAERTGGLSDADLEALGAFAEGLPSTVGAVLAPASPPVASEDGEAVQIFVPVDADADVPVAVEELDAALQDAIPGGVTARVTGPAGFTADLTAAFAGIDGLLLVVALAVVLVILVAVYRSPLLPILVLLTSLSALCAAILVNFQLARNGVVQLNGQVQGILFILVIGAATDYSLLYVARFREALRDRASATDATVAALKGSIEPIVASGGTVIAGLMCLVLSDLSSNAALGPVASIGIAFSILAALTFLPALLLLAGRVAFWPRRPLAGSPHPAVTGPEATGFWPRLGRWIARRPRPVWTGMTALLLVGCLGLLGLRAGGVPQSEFVLGPSDAREGQQILTEHFDDGSGTPAYVVVPEDSALEVMEAAREHEGVSSVAVTAQDSPSGTLPYQIAAPLLGGEAPTGPPAGDDADPGEGPPPGVDAAGENPFAGVEPTVSGGDVLVQVTLADAADSAAAEQTIVELRRDLRAVDPDVLVGGSTATDLDTDVTSAQDRNQIIPLILAVILVILMLLLRSVLAPVLLVITTVISFGTALGVSSLLFNHVFEFSGSDPSVPLYGFVFLVALGIDYNIFLMTRVREESLRHGTRLGTQRGLAVTGGVITSAGIVLAATFAALSVIPVQFLLQLAVIVSLGVLLDALLVRSLLVPALAIDLGNRIWWPAALSRRTDTDRADPELSGGPERARRPEPTHAA